uniref:F-box/LRR-repeat protein 15/At3g58940/PEG3-like LRR domain-containing protein n=2 Tax=Oryza TaxID=4527 RepID=A0A0D3GPK1_9ORYZ
MATKYITLAEVALHAIIIACPLLETLLLEHIYGFHCFRISSPRLRASRNSGYSVANESANPGCPLSQMIAISCPCLSHFSGVASKLEIMGWLGISMLKLGIIEIQLYSEVYAIMKIRIEDRRSV